jgi:ribonuclease D
MGPGRRHADAMESTEQTAIEAEERPGYDRRMRRDEINALPMRRYEGPIDVIGREEDVPAAIEALTGHGVLGFDTETRPSFRKGESYPPALIQLTNEDRSFLFQLSKTGIPTGLRDLLSNPEVVKAGVAPAHDFNMLTAMTPFEAAGVVDLSVVARAQGIQNHGLRGLAAVLLGFRISKGSQVSNWAREELTEAQVTYAATDSWVSREIYLQFERLGVEMTPGRVLAKEAGETAS